MQQRMKDFPMTPEAVTALLKRAAVGRISTIGADEIGRASCRERV